MPQYYLRGFTNSQDRLFVYDAQENKYFQTSTNNIAAESDFHTVDIADISSPDPWYLEKKLANELEGPHSKFLTDLLISLDNKSTFMTNQHKSVLAEMVSLQLLRTPRIRQQLWERAAEEAENPDTTYTQSEFAKLTHILMLDATKFQTLPNIKMHLSEFTFQFLEVPEDSPYITSDCPVITGITNRDSGKMSLTKSQGIGRAGAELYFPLSKKYLLVLIKDIDLEGIKDCQIRQMNDKYSEEFNIMMKSASDRWIYSPFDLKSLRA